MKVDLFDFELPPHLIADRPVAPRDAARLLEVRREGLRDLHMRDLPDLLRAGDLLVVNDTRVIPARLIGRRGEARIEIMLHKQEHKARWRALARPAKKLRPGEVVTFADDFSGTIVDKLEAGEVIIELHAPDGLVFDALMRHGQTPLPPYIKRQDGPSAADATDYQTLFAAHPGAVAAPTAGLHFTAELLERLRARGIGIATLTLHVGAGTFLPVKTEHAEDHVMHGEYGILSAQAAASINAARSVGGRIVAVGTTALRLLESAADAHGQVHEFAGETKIFILPGYRFKAVDLLLTNFHLPRSSLFMLVSAFAGLARMKRAYEHAKQTGYRFYSYGDACLLHPEAEPGP